MKPAATKGLSEGVEFWLKLALPIVSISLSVLVLYGAEIFLKWNRPELIDDVVTMHVPSETYGWELRPSHTAILNGALATTNSQGYRGRGYSYDRKSSTQAIRVVMLGDSIAYGYGVRDDQTFSSLMDRPPFEVINLAVQGYGTDQSLLTLQHKGLQFHPDVVVLNVCLANDSVDNASPRFIYDNVHVKPYYRMDDRGTLVLHDDHLRKSRFEIMMFDVFSRSFTARWLMSTVGTAMRSITSVDSVKNLKPKPDPQLTALLINRVGEIASSHGARYIVALHPSKHDFPNLSPVASEIVEHFLVSLPSQQKTRVVDLRQAYVAMGLTFGQISFDRSGHLTVKGHETVAYILTSIIRDQDTRRERADDLNWTRLTDALNGGAIAPTEVGQ